MSDLNDLENELRAALAERADRIRPQDRWEEITMTTTRTHDPRRWPVVLLAAAAVVAVVVGVLALRPQPGEPVPASPTPTPSDNTSSAPPSPSTSPSPSGSTTPSEQAADAPLPVYYIGLEAHGWPESGLGLRRDWISPPREGRSPQERVADALTAAMARSIATEGGQTPWSGVGHGLVSATRDRIDIALTAAPTTDLPDNVSSLAVQQLVWTAQAAFGAGNVPVHFTLPGGETRLWSTDITRAQVRPVRAEQYTVLADLWLTEPAHNAEAAIAVAAGTPTTFSGEASVFEANVQWQLTRDDGTVVDRGVVMASAGAPDRGTFTIRLTVATPGDYVLKAFSVSMKDGQGEVANDRVRLVVG